MRKRYEPFTLKNNDDDTDVPLLDSSDNNNNNRMSMGPKLEELKPKQKTVLRRLNIAGAIVHGVSFVGALAIAIWAQVVGFSTSVPGILTWDMGALISGGTFIDPSLIPPPSYSGPYPLLWVDIPFPLVTAMFHALIAFSPTVWDYYLIQIQFQRRNPLRWLEYSITGK